MRRSFGNGVIILPPHGVWLMHKQSFMKRCNQMPPIGRLMKVEEIVGTALYLASDASWFNLLAGDGWTVW